MNERERLKEQLVYITSDEWLKNNGKFKRTIINVNRELGFSLSFQKNGDKKPFAKKGNDLIKLTIELYDAIS